MAAMCNPGARRGGVDGRFEGCSRPEVKSLMCVAVF